MGFDMTFRLVKFILAGDVSKIPSRSKAFRCLPVGTSRVSSRYLIVLNGPIGIDLDVLEVERIEFEYVGKCEQLGRNAGRDCGGVTALTEPHDGHDREDNHTKGNVDCKHRPGPDHACSGTGTYDSGLEGHLGHRFQ
jgi:hypothetical protein